MARPRKPVVIPQIESAVPVFRIMQVENDALALMDSTDTEIDRQYYNATNPDARPFAASVLRKRAPKDIEIVDVEDGE